MVLRVKAMKPWKDRGGVGQRLGRMVVEGFGQLFDGDAVNWRGVAELLVAEERMKK